MGTWVAIALVAVLSLTVAAVVTLTQTSRLADDVLSARALLAAQADEVERYLQSTRQMAAAMASTDAIADAAGRFADAYQQLGDLDPEVVEAATTDLTDQTKAPGLVGRPVCVLPSSRTRTGRHTVASSAVTRTDVCLSQVAGITRRVTPHALRR